MVGVVGRGEAGWGWGQPVNRGHLNTSNLTARLPPPALHPLSLSAVTHYTSLQQSRRLSLLLTTTGKVDQEHITELSPELLAPRTLPAGSQDRVCLRPRFLLTCPEGQIQVAHSKPWSVFPLRARVQPVPGNPDSWLPPRGFLPPPSAL